MNPLPMRLNTGEFLAETAHLRPDETGSYIRLLVHYWSRGGHLPADPMRLANIANVPTDCWAAIAPALAALFVVDGTGWRHARLDRELANGRTS